MNTDEETRERLPIVLEWEDASCLAAAVERLDAELSHARRLERYRRWMAPLLFVLAASVAGAATAGVAGGPSTWAALAALPMFAGALRAAILPEVDAEIAAQRSRVAQSLRDVDRHLATSDWLLEA